MIYQVGHGGHVAAQALTQGGLLVPTVLAKLADLCAHGGPALQNLTRVCRKLGLKSALLVLRERVQQAAGVFQRHGATAPNIWRGGDCQRRREICLIEEEEARSLRPFTKRPGDPTRGKHMLERRGFFSVHGEDFVEVRFANLLAAPLL